MNFATNKSAVNVSTRKQSHQSSSRNLDKVSERFAGEKLFYKLNAQREIVKKISCYVNYILINYFRCTGDSF